MYWFACCNISGTIVDGYSISDQKNQEGRSPIKNAWIASEGLALGIARISIAKRPTGEGFLTSLSEVEERCGPDRNNDLLTACTSLPNATFFKSAISHQCSTVITVAPTAAATTLICRLQSMQL
ncbi:hypothetical protein GW17_00024336 [Ensete ventricosum]|nr:hypothetical protein GW17_00024336 [Ensete ventricosum]